MSVADSLSEHAQHQLNHIAVIDAASGRRHTFKSFDNRANQIAHFCEQWVGLLPGDCLGLLSTPSDDVLQIVVAAGKLGLTVLFLDPVASSDTLIASINEHGPRTVFYGLAQADLVQEIWFEVDSVEHFIPLRGAVDTANFEDIVTHYPPLPLSVSPGEDVPWVFFAADKTAWLPEEIPIGEIELEDALHTVARPLNRPDGLGTALRALLSGLCVIVKEASVEVIESPAGIRPADEADSASQRNVPQGRSWLPREFM
jgi:acyl-CoA synthetase (AMP-forming)/AMP-acid ligase II